MAAERFAYVWEYHIVPRRRPEFLAHYGADGNWALLFRRDAAYLGTTLLQDFDNENRYVTIDYWESKSDRDRFRRLHARDFDELDTRCEAFTERETFLGNYLEPDAAAQ